MSSVPSQPSTTVIYGIESGHFEAQTLLAVECLRRFGGRFANVPVLAITPRLGPSLTRDTLRRFDELEVTYIRQDLGHPYSWYCYMNKASAAMLAAEEYASTEQIIWLDSDTLVIAEPELLWLDPDIDFAICSTDKNVGTSGPGDKNEPYWLALSEYYGIDINQLPWVVTEVDQKRVRFRLHSGVFAFRRNSGLGKGYLKACEQMLDSRIAYSDTLPFPGDDVALAFAVVLLNLRWRLLPLSYNYEMLPESPMYTHDSLLEARILHYHYAMTTPSTCAWALTEIESKLPELYNWLKDRVPLKTKIGGLHRLLFRRALKEWRTREQSRFGATCQQFG
jgi:hypothetical protein